MQDGILCAGWNENSILHTRQLAIRNNKYQWSYKYSYSSWWWTWRGPKHVEVTNKIDEIPFLLRILCTKLVSFTRLEWNRQKKHNSQTWQQSLKKGGGGQDVLRHRTSGVQKMKGSIPCWLLLLTFLSVKIYKTRSTKITTLLFGPKHKVVLSCITCDAMKPRSGDTVYLCPTNMDCITSTYEGCLSN